MGYAISCLQLAPATPARRVTVTHLLRLAPEARQARLSSVARNNIETTLRILKFNHWHGIRLYRVASELIPLATHEQAQEWDWEDELGPLLRAVGEYAAEKGIRLSAHPDHYVLLNSPRSEVRSVAEQVLNYHHRLFQAMGLPHAQLVIHLGGRYDNRAVSLARFCSQFASLPASIADRLIIENDDRSYSAGETLAVCEKLRRPMVFDYLHHRLNPGTEQLPLVELLQAIKATWARAGLDHPKVHLSSSASSTRPRHHAPYVEVSDCLDLLRGLSEANFQQVDIMLEAKAKEQATLSLVEQLSSCRTYRAGEGAVFDWDD